MSKKSSSEKLMEMLDIPLSAEKRKAIIEILIDIELDFIIANIEGTGSSDYLESMLRGGYKGFDEKSDSELLEEIKEPMETRKFTGSVDEFIKSYEMKC